MTNDSNSNMPPKKYQLQQKDIRFLKAVDQILEYNEITFRLKESDASLSKRVFNKGNIGALDGNSGVSMVKWPHKTDTTVGIDDSS